MLTNWQAAWKFEFHGMATCKFHAPIKLCENLSLKLGVGSRTYIALETSFAETPKQPLRSLTEGMCVFEWVHFEYKDDGGDGSLMRHFSLDNARAPLVKFQPTDRHKSGRRVQ